MLNILPQVPQHFTNFTVNNLVNIEKKKKAARNNLGVHTDDLYAENSCLVFKSWPETELSLRHMFFEMRVKSV